ncbi:MAG: outer membrane protein transport protein [Arenicellales bacterium]
MKFVNRFTLGLSILGLLLPLSANATNGLYQHGYGVRANAMAGAGVALPLDALAAATNPAGTVMIGNRKDIGLALFSPQRSYTATGAPSGGFPPLPGPEVDSESTLFAIPSFGWSKSINDVSAFSLSVYGNGGMNTDWKASDTPTITTPMGPAAGTFLAGDAGVDYSQLFINLNYAGKISEGSSIGISGIINYSQLELKGLQGFSGFSVDPTKLTNNGKEDDIGFGIKIGGLFALTDKLDLGVSYQSEIRNNLNDYGGLFANRGDLNIPATATIGLGFEINERSSIAFDVQQIFYGNADAIGNPGTLNPTSGLFACAGGDFTSCLGGSNGAGFGWEDMTIVKLGYQIQTSDDMIWRFGVSHGDQPIPNNEVTLNIIAPGVVETHVTAGFSKTLANGNDLSLALMYAPEKCVNGPSAFNPGQTIELCMNQFQLELGYSW